MTAPLTLDRPADRAVVGARIRHLDRPELHSAVDPLYSFRDTDGLIYFDGRNYMWGHISYDVARRSIGRPYSRLPNR
jgi:hypothetical protein